MRLSNRNKAPFYNFVLTLLNVIFILGVFAYILEKTRLAMFGSEEIFFVVIPILLLFLFFIRGRQIFEYDSDGEAVNFKNRHILPFLGNEARDEFPKYKIISFEIVNALIFRKLYIKIKSKKDHSAIVLKYDISYLSGREIKDLKMSLKKIVKANIEAKIEGKTQEQ